ncbi:IS701 family transposase [Halomonas stenophila]|uniref:SRSO17 transposase n=1 Tax=Halomonas stenophila TaxID=795312 RepID=A0A7W5HN60_9GAMM|nr:IS701 family transposase [Halomonas stenophila]MBB3233155.1 SRSO17 transposase [Halomonas stenophila]
MSRSTLHDGFDAYLDGLAPQLGHADRVRSFKDYCYGLMLSLPRKSIEPIAASLDPENVQARHQALHHLVAKAPWSDRALLMGVAQWVLPHFLAGATPYWVIDDTSIRKKGRHSVGVSRQYCGEIGKQDNCQVAVSLSVATERASLPVAWRLYLPQSWTDDPARCRRAGVPSEVTFATKPEIALQQVRETLDAGITPGIVLADAAYGKVTAWREQLAEWGLSYCVGVRDDLSVWAPGTEPLPPEWSGKGRPPTRWQQTAEHHPVSADTLAHALESAHYQTVTWREGTNKPLRSRFAAVRVRVARGMQYREPEWLLVEWPEGADEPAKYWLSNLPEDTSLTDLVITAKARWRIERDYQELKQEFGLDHYEGRNWRGFHHHASLCITAYGFLVAERLRRGEQKKIALFPAPALPEAYRPRGRTTRPTPRE